jgi:hypothetical protein
MLLRNIAAALAALTLLASVETANAGPFGEFFKQLRDSFRNGNEASRSHHSTSQKHHSSGIKSNSDSSSTATKTTGPPSDRNTRAASRVGAKGAGGDLKYGTPVAGKKGFVTSPFSPDAGYIDVRGFGPGTAVKDPYSGKVFLTP